MREIKIELKPSIKKLEIYVKKGVTYSPFAGGYTAAFKGHGLEFAGFRAYTQSDDASMIEWKASLRAHELLVKELQEEKNIIAFLLFDVSNSMLFSSIEKLKCEYAAELIASFSYALIKSGNTVGLGMFTDKFVMLVPPSLSSAQYHHICMALKNPKLYGGKYDLGSVLTNLKQVSGLYKDSVVIIISDFIGFKEKWVKELDNLIGNYLPYAIIVRDPLDYKLPRKVGEVIIADPYSSEELIIDVDKVREAYEIEAKKQLDRVKRIFRGKGIGFLELITTQSFVAPVVRFFGSQRK